MCGIIIGSRITSDGGQGAMDTVPVRALVILIVLSVAAILVGRGQTWPHSESAKPQQANAGAANSTVRPPFSTNTDNQKTEESRAKDGNSTWKPNILVKVAQESDDKDSYSFPVSKWIRLAVQKILSWPFLVLILFAYLLFSKNAPSRLQSLFKPFASFKLLGQEFVMSREGGENVEDGINLIRSEIENTLDKEVYDLGLKTKHENLVDQIIASMVVNFQDLKVRSTLYVLDRLFDETVYQLVDYYPTQAVPGRSRTYSTRYGIIGKTWRSEESQYDATVPTAEGQLILEWGMTLEEAKKAAHGRQSFGCVALKNSRTSLVALLYLDAPQPNAFGDKASWQKLEGVVQVDAAKSQLIAGLDIIHSQTLHKGPRIHTRKV